MFLRLSLFLALLAALPWAQRASAQGASPAIERFVMGIGPDGAPAEPDGDSFLAEDARVFSDDGTKFVFMSRASNLIPGLALPEGITQVYVKDVERGTYALVSEKDGAAGWDHSMDASISPDGTKVVFTTRASNLVGEATSNHGQLLLKDLESGRLTVLSRSRITGALADESILSPQFSPDGKLIAFFSYAAQLTAGDEDRFSDVFLVPYTGRADDYKNLVLASTTVEGEPLYGSAYDPLFSPDGRSLIFQSVATNSSGESVDYHGPRLMIRPLSQEVLREDKMKGPLEEVYFFLEGKTNIGECFPLERALAADGNQMAFYLACSKIDHEEKLSSTKQLIIYTKSPHQSWGKAQKAEIPLTIPSSEEKELWLSNLAFSADGRALALEASTTWIDPKLDPNDNPEVVDPSQIYILDMPSRQLTLLSRTSYGAQGDAESTSPIFTKDGQTIIFSSFAGNLVPYDANEASDIFIARVP